MKRIFNIIVGLLIFVPFANVNAISCYSGLIDVEKINNFPCSDVSGETITFKDSSTGEDLSKYFSFVKTDTNATISIVDKTIKFDASKEIGTVNIGDGVNETIIQIKNSAYVEPTTTTTTTTKDANTKTLTVTLDPNDGTSQITAKTCELTSNNTTCSITLPKIDKDTFNGWGTAASCKEGNSGTIKVEKDITYYACYTDNNQDEQNDSENNESTTLLLKSLALTDKTSNESIDIGTFSIKKNEYSFKVLNTVENINVNAEAEEGIKVEITGNENLTVGENKITIKLTDENNNTNEYVLNVTRLASGETLNTIHYLKSLVIGGDYNIDFNKEKFVYNVTIPSDIDKLVIDPVAENEADYVEIKNNENLMDGSVISIIVSGDDETPTTYSINITKESSVNYLLIGAIALIVVLIIVLIILIIVKSNKKKKDATNKTATDDKVEVLNI